MRAWVLLISLAGCATDPKPCPLAPVKVQTVEVVRTVQKPCAATRPAMPAKLPRPMPTGSDAVIAVLTDKLAEWAGAGGYGERADMAIADCKAS